MNRKSNTAILIALVLAFAVLVLLGVCFFLPSIDTVMAEKEPAVSSLADAVSGSDETSASGNVPSAGDLPETTASSATASSVTTNVEETSSKTTETSGKITSSTTTGISGKTTSTTAAKTTATTDARKNAEYVVNPNYESKYYIVVFAGKSQSVAVYSKDNTGAYTVLSKCFTCSTGAKSSPTRTGQYKIWRRFEWRLLVGNVYGQYSTSISSSYLFHSVPYLKKDASTLDMAEYDKLGTPASHGCIRLCVRDAKWIYEHCPNGTQVNVVNASGPEGAGYPARNKDSIYNGWDPSDTNPNSPYIKTPTTTTTESTTTTAETTIEATTTAATMETTASDTTAATTAATTTVTTPSASESATTVPTTTTTVSLSETADRTNPDAAEKEQTS